MSHLDSLDKIRKFDKKDLSRHILALPDDLQKAYKDVMGFKLPSSFGGFKSVVMGGMGGSGVAAHIVHDLVDFKVPMEVVNDYYLPKWVSRDTLVVLISHSGYTEEIISLYKEAETITDKIFVISEGNNAPLERLAKRGGELFYDYNNNVPPRFSLGEQLGALLGLINLLGLSDNKLCIEEAVEFGKTFGQGLIIESKTDNNFAKKLAFEIFDHVPVVVASGIIKTVAYRWQTQFNENSKSFGYHLVFPEAAHNAVVGIELPTRSKDDLFFLLLKNKFTNKHTLRRMDLFAKLLNKEKISYKECEVWGDTKLTQVLSTLLLGDWTSYYLAILNNVDPEPTQNIEWMKKLIDQGGNKSTG